MASHQAKIAAAKALREKAIAELPGAIALGQELKAEYDRLAGLFAAARDQAATFNHNLQALYDRESQLLATNPNKQTIPDKAEQAQWGKEMARVDRERAALVPQAREAARLRDQYQLEAVKAEKAYRGQEQAVWNLKQRRDDPTGEILRVGNLPGVVLNPLTRARI